MGFKIIKSLGSAVLFTTLLNKSSYKKITDQNYIVEYKPKSLKSDRQTFLQKLFSKVGLNKSVSSVNIIAIVVVMLVILWFLSGGSKDGGGHDEDLVLRLGTALPLTGDLARMGPPTVAGATLAINEVNDAKKGIRIDVIFGDSGDLDNKVYDTEIPRLLDGGVQAIIGAVSSGVSEAFIDRVIAKNVILFSPGNTSAVFSSYEDKGLYFRTTPSDIRHGQVLGELIAEDGHTTVSFIVRNNPYSLSIYRPCKAALKDAGGTVTMATFEASNTDFSYQINKALGVNPDAIVLITDRASEAELIVSEIIKRSFSSENLYFGGYSLWLKVAHASLKDAKGTLSGIDPRTIPNFIKNLKSAMKILDNKPDSWYPDYIKYGAETYDAVILLALAALEARSTQGVKMSKKLREVSGGSGGGTKCTSFAACADIINAGGTADYDGPSGKITFNEFGDPTDGNILIRQFNKNNVLFTIDTPPK